VWSVAALGLFHFRARTGVEVDLVLEDGDRNVAGIEVKAATTVSAADPRGLEFLRDKLGERFRLGVLLHTGPQALPFVDRLWVLPYKSMWA
jgi:predicted AAA+ superfamily ATPase